jgi:type I restriction enzyme M protein
MSSTEIRKHALTFLEERLLKILLDFENVYSPQLEKKVDGITPVAKTANTRKKAKGETREQMMISAMDTADVAEMDSFFSDEQTSSQRLFAHLFEACNILRGPINQVEYKSYVTPICFSGLSDVYDEETDVAIEEIGCDENLRVRKTTFLSFRRGVIERCARSQ